MTPPVNRVSNQMASFLEPDGQQSRTPTYICSILLPSHLLARSTKHTQKPLQTTDNFHSPFTRHRNRHGGGVALYTRTNLPATRLHQLKTAEEEWIWTRTKIDDNIILTFCLYLPPNLTSERLEQFINRFTDSVCLAQTYSPTTIIITGDFNAGNIFLEDQSENHSGITHFDTKLYVIYSLNLVSNDKYTNQTDRNHR